MHPTHNRVSMTLDIPLMIEITPQPMWRKVYNCTKMNANKWTKFQNELEPTTAAALAKLLQEIPSINTNDKLESAITQVQQIITTQCELQIGSQWICTNRH